jgi:hypothetical protein
MFINFLVSDLYLIPVPIYASFFPAPLSRPWRLTMSKFRDRLFYLSAYSTKGSSYEDMRDHTFMQNTHYAYGSTDGDLHWMRKLGKIIGDIFFAWELVEKKFLKSLPDWKSLGKVTHADWSRMGWIAI